MTGMITFQTSRARLVPMPKVAGVRAAGPILQRKCACETNPDLEDATTGRLQRMAADPVSMASVPSIVYDVLHSSGQPLDSAAREFLEPRFGHDFSRVRVHTDAQAAQSARAMHALAYTVGPDLVFGGGQYRPDTMSGRSLLAHELTHVVQQSASSASAPHDLQIGGVSTACEREAHDNARRVAAGAPAQVQQGTGMSLQGAWDWTGAGVGALTGAAAGAALGAIGGPIGALIGLGAGLLIGGIAGGLLGGAAQPSDIQRRCDQVLDRVRQHPVYRALAAAARAVADDIMTVARSRNNCLYYAEKLLLLLNTPEAPRATGGQPPPQGSTLAMNRQRVEQAAREERTRLATPEGRREVRRQERIADDPSRRWTARRGQNNKIFYVDSSDPNNIVVRIKIRLLAAGAVTTSRDIADEISLEDAIERVAETRGYVVDVIFVDRDGPDVFTFNIDFDRWPTSANPVGNARTLAHEIHHLMGLPDRYDYIESHAANPNMDIPTRLHWFREQMNRQPDPNQARSLMGSGRTMLDDDVCRVAGLDLQSCMAARARATAP